MGDTLYIHIYIYVYLYISGVLCVWIPGSQSARATLTSCHCGVAIGVCWVGWTNILHDLDEPSQKNITLTLAHIQVGSPATNRYDQKCNCRQPPSTACWHRPPAQGAMFIQFLRRVVSVDSKRRVRRSAFGVV